MKVTFLEAVPSSKTITGVDLSKKEKEAKASVTKLKSQIDKSTKEMEVLREEKEEAERSFKDENSKLKAELKNASRTITGGPGL